MNHHILSNHDSDTTLQTVEALTETILANTDSVFEKRLQATAFLTELQWLLTTDKNSEQQRLSPATYQRTPRGVYSPEIRTALTELKNVYARVAYDHGYRTKKYYTEPVTKPDSPTSPDALTVITEFTESTHSHSKEDLMTHCTEIPHVKTTSTGDEITVTRAAEHYQTVNNK